MLSQLTPRVNNHRLRVGKLGASPNADSSLINVKNRFSRFKSSLKLTTFTNNHARNQDLPNRHQGFGDQTKTGEVGPLNVKRIWSPITENDLMHIRTGQGIDGISDATSANDEGKKSSQGSQSINGKENKERGSKHGKTTLERITNIKNQFPRFRSPFRIKSTASNIASHGKPFSNQKGCGNKTNEEAICIEDLKTQNLPATDDKLLLGGAGHYSDSVPATYPSMQNFVEPHGKELRVKNKKATLKCDKSPSRKLFIACGDSKIENTGSKNQFKCNVFIGTPEEIMAEQTNKKNAPDNHSAQSTSPMSCPRLGFIERRSGEITHTSYVAMLNTERDEFENIKRITARRFWGLEQQFNCKIMLSDKPSQMRARTVYKLEIRGTSFREVAKCRNALPKFITERLTTKAENTAEEIPLGNA
ncbi:unnamed protein product [Hymenolepis diminuta]|uniref:Uncharacterized protein n=1 Tax=Hymenolepis diminuta TaxID=6216 RepID=A0A564YBE4_HYMDI|nr:unnamed protein product [Hymenolepis diminuta]